MKRVSIVIPFHWMKDWEFFLSRCLKSIEIQSFKDYEIVLMKVDSMPITSNRVMESARGELVKIIYMDDYFAHEHALQKIVDTFDYKDTWLVTGCLHQRSDGKKFYEDPHSPHLPKYTKDLYTGNNGIGSPSVVTLKREGMLLFDPKLSFLLDCDLYHRYYQTYGAPKILNDLNIVIGIHSDQTSNTMPDIEKLGEYKYVKSKYD